MMKNEENKYFYLIKNVIILVIGNFGSKFLSFILLPLYTSILTTEEYGTADVIINTVGLLIPIFTLNIYDAVFRIAIERKSDKEKVFRTGCAIFGVGFVFVIVLLGINTFFNVVPILSKNIMWCLMLYGFQAFNSILIQYARATECVKAVAVSGVLSTFTICGVNIICLVAFSMGMKGYLLATVMGYIVSDIYLFCRLNLFKVIKKYPRIKLPGTLCREMLAYSTPLIATNVSWWVINASDRYMVTGFCGVGENGIYSIAYRIPGILAVFQSLFAQAWQISAVNENDNISKGKFYKTVYSQYSILNVFICCGLIVFNRPLAALLFAKDFYSAWQYVPWLLFGTVFSALSGYIGGILAAVKDTKGLAVSCVLGAGANVVLNLICIRLFGASGAAYATVVAYIVTYVYRLWAVRKHLGILLCRRKEILTYCFLFVMCIVSMFNSTSVRYGLSSIVIAIVFALTWDDTKTILRKVTGMIRARKEEE